ncbi:hypothetical protein O6P43_010986 [Quillaja saponaria]|uniref:Uncharacterized protein n=1 Tax=Quillaja saponaria TaxID=32244 RepID=A0AAD7Q1P4_QUISA|nr:hypothetical protein O6P43_010986 [Quillaja saponaria]
MEVEHSLVCSALKQIPWRVPWRATKRRCFGLESFKRPRFVLFYIVGLYTVRPLPLQWQVNGSVLTIAIAVSAIPATLDFSSLISSSSSSTSYNQSSQLPKTHILSTAPIRNSNCLDSSKPSLIHP